MQYALADAIGHMHVKLVVGTATIATPQENGWPLWPKDGVVEKWGGGGGPRNQGGALRWANRRPFGARTSQQTSDARQTKSTSKAGQDAAK